MRTHSEKTSPFKVNISILPFFKHFYRISSIIIRTDSVLYSRNKYIFPKTLHLFRIIYYLCSLSFFETLCNMTRRETVMQIVNKKLMVFV
jgi:hypothetical protein